MSAELALIGAVLGPAAVFLYAAFKLSERHSVLGTFMFLLSMLFTSFSAYVAGFLAREYSVHPPGGGDPEFPYAAFGSVFDYIGLGSFFVFFVTLLYFALIIYMHDAFRESVFGDSKSA